MKNCFLDALTKRRSIYHLNKDLPVNKPDLITILETCIKNVPSAFNSQSQRMCLLLDQNHQQLWQIVLDTLQKIVPPDKFSATQKKINLFSQAFATILFFEDEQTINTFQKQNPLYADQFALWSEQSSGMLQFAVWTALAEFNIGASLQHYNPLIDQEVKSTWTIPQHWKLIAQMPFGNIETPPDTKSFLPLNERFKVYY